jgi:D-aspartate ligase
MMSAALGERSRSAAWAGAETSPVGAVVLGADYRGLGVVRSLGRRGIPVIVLIDGDDTLAAKSRYARKRLQLSGATDAERCEFLLRLADRYKLEGWVLFPTGDESAAFVARCHERLSDRFTPTSPPWDTLRWAYDKQLTYRLADTLGMPYPRTWNVSSPDQAWQLDLPFPVIVKPATKPELNSLTAAKAWPAGNRDELRLRVREAAALVDADVLMIQELIPRKGSEQLSYAALCDGGRPLASITARRVRQYPADLGRASTYVETIDCAEVAESGQRFLSECRFDGLAEVEFMRDPRDGALKLLDVNPRVWGWHGLCQRAGVDFPYLAYERAVFHSVSPSQARPGVRWLRLSTDLPTAAREILRGNIRALPYLRTLFQRHDSATFARDDPAPAFHELPMLVTTMLRRLRDGVPV